MSEKNILSVVKNTIATMFETSTEYKRIFSPTNAPLNKHYSYTHNVDIDFENAALTPDGIKNAIAPILLKICEGVMGDLYSHTYDKAESVVYHSDITDGTLYESVTRADQILNENIIHPKTILEIPSILYYGAINKELVTKGITEVLITGTPKEFCGVPLRYERLIHKTTSDMGDVKYKCLLRDINSISFAISDFTVTLVDGKIKVDVDYTYNVDEPKALIVLDVCIPF